MGKVLVFQHDLLHQGSVVTSGVKYAMRTDLMFTRRPGAGVASPGEEAPSQAVPERQAGAESTPADSEEGEERGAESA